MFRISSYLFIALILITEPELPAQATNGAVLKNTVKTNLRTQKNRDQLSTKYRQDKYKIAALCKNLSMATFNTPMIFLVAARYCFKDKGEPQTEYSENYFPRLIKESRIQKSVFHIPNCIEKAIQGSGSNNLIYLPAARTKFALNLINQSRQSDHKDSPDTTRRPSGLYGGIKGRVLDDKKEPIVGACVMIVGTGRGANTNINGEFNIMKIYPANYDIKFFSVGYKDKRLELTIPQNLTVDIGDVILESSVSDTIIVAAKRMINCKLIGSISSEKTSDIAKTPGSSVLGVVGLSSGSVSSGDGWAIRGARTSETEIRVDHTDIGESLPRGTETIAPSDGRTTAPLTALAGVLTSGEINDFRKWDLWKDISENELKTYRDMWLFNPRDRYVIQLVNKDNRAAVDYEVKLLDTEGAVVWTGRSDNTGKVELWANLFEGSNGNKEGFSVSIDVNGRQAYKENIMKFHEGINTIVIDDYCKIPETVDIVFAVDATGSMGDEIAYLKAELNDIIGKLKNSQANLKINLGSIFYRDKTDSYIVRQSDLSPNIETTIKFINAQQAEGGGDGPEAVDIALLNAVNKISWSKNAVARIMFLILDAPPHETPGVMNNLKEVTAKAALLGIRIIPVACSGIDKSTEYLMRSLALATNGTYVFLTNDSHVGGSHIEPTTDKYDVELLNDLFIRLINQFTSVPSCNNEIAFTELDTVDNIFNRDEAKLQSSDPANLEILNNVSCFPNPTSGDLTIEITGEIEELFIVDLCGKILEKPDIGNGRNSVDLSLYPTGIYFIKFMSGNKWGSKKILLGR